MSTSEQELTKWLHSRAEFWDMQVGALHWWQFLRRAKYRGYATAYHVAYEMAVDLANGHVEGGAA